MFCNNLDDQVFLGHAPTFGILDTPIIPGLPLVVIPGSPQNLSSLLLPKPYVTETPVAKTASYALNCDICPLVKWGLEHLSAYKGDFATRTSGHMRNAGKIQRTGKVRWVAERRSGGRRRGAGSMRVSAGSHGVGKALDGELAQLVRQAGLTSAQTSAVIPAGTAPSLAARVRRNPNFAVTPPPPGVLFRGFLFFSAIYRLKTRNGLGTENTRIRTERGNPTSRGTFPL